MYHIGEVVDAAGLSLRTIEHHAELRIGTAVGAEPGKVPSLPR